MSNVTLISCCSQLLTFFPGDQAWPRSWCFIRFPEKEGGLLCEAFWSQICIWVSKLSYILSYKGTYRADHKFVLKTDPCLMNFSHYTVYKSCFFDCFTREWWVQFMVILNGLRLLGTKQPGNSCIWNMKGSNFCVGCYQRKVYWKFLHCRINKISAKRN